MRAFAFCLLLMSVVPPARARERFHPRVALLGGPVQEVVASASRVGALQGGEVVILNGDGDLLRRWAPEAPQRLPDSTERHGPSAEELMALAGIPDDDLESPLVEELLLTEGIRPLRHSKAAHVREGDRFPVIRALAIAAEGNDLWAATDGGLARLVRGGARDRWRVLGGPRGAEVTALAVSDDGSVVATVAGSRVLRSTDHGHSFAMVLELTSAARGVAVSADGAFVFVLDSQGAWEIFGSREPRLLLAHPGQHLVWCEGRLLVLSLDGLHVISPKDAPIRIGGGIAGSIPARRLRCSAAVPGVIAAVGPRLMVSRDRGRSWNQRQGDDFGGLVVNDAAIAPGRIWAATAAGLFEIPLNLEDRPASLPAAPDSAPAHLDAPVPRPETSGTWQELLPRVTMSLTADRSTQRGSDLRLWLLLSFPLGRVAPPPGAGLAWERLRRRTALAAALARLPPPGADEECDAERLSLTAAWEDLP